VISNKCYLRIRSSYAGKGQQAALIECKVWSLLLSVLRPTNPGQVHEIDHSITLNGVHSTISNADFIKSHKLHWYNPLT